MDALDSEDCEARGVVEIELMFRAQAGDAHAFSEIIQLHHAALLRQAIALCRDGSTAEDLAQETFVQAWKSIHRFNGQCRAFTWLCSILIHRHRNYLRKRRAIPFSFLFGWEREAAETRLSEVPDVHLLPDESAAISERSAELLRSLELLPAKQRDVVYLRFYAQDSLDGIAAALGCSVGTVKSRLFNGLERLRKMKSIRNS